MNIIGGNIKDNPKTYFFDSNNINVKINDLVNPILDKIDFIDENYIVGICSKEKGCD